jgi:hypothetical protein
LEAIGSFDYRRPLTIDAVQVTGSANLLNFPVLISFTHLDLRTTANGGHVAHPNGYDIVFRAADGVTRLDFELESYDGASGTVNAWVRIPVLSYNVNTVLYVYYGNDEIVCSQENAAAVWDSNYNGVWHLAESSGTQRDSTSNGADGTTQGTVTQNVAGRIAGGDEFEGPGSVSWIEVADQSFPANTPFTLETWVYPFSTRAEYVGLLTKGRTGADPYWVGLWIAPGNVLSFGWGWDVGQSGNLEGTTTLPPNQWHHIAAVFDGTTQRLYYNGAPDPGSTPQANFYLDIPDLSRIGGAANTQYLDGWMDEARISRVARSPDWIQTSYNSMASPGTFFSLGAEENGPYSWPLAVNIRSIGTSPGTLYSVGNASIGIGATTVTFAGGASLPANVGAGDQLVIGGETFFIRTRDSATQVTVQTAATANHASQAYTIARAYTTLLDWETARDGDLVLEQRREIGMIYNDGPFTAGASIAGSTTDCHCYMHLTVAEGQRHDGTAAVGAVLDGMNTDQGIRVSDDYTVVEWLSFRRNRGVDGAAGVVVHLARNVLLSRLLIYDFYDAVNLVSGIRGQDNAGYTVRNTIIYDGGRAGIRNNHAGAVGVVENCTIFKMDPAGTGAGILVSAGTLTATNTISMGNSPTRDFSGPMTQSYNLSSDATAAGTGSLTGLLASNQFVSVTAGTEDLHLRAGANALDAGVDLSGTFWDDIDGQSRLTLTWDMGADESEATTAVSLSSFQAVGVEGGVRLEWRTDSELQNLGFLLYRSHAASGPYERLTDKLIPGLGSSAVGAHYQYVDTGALEGQEYYYQLEDVEVTGLRRLHGPVVATPLSTAEAASESSTRILYGAPGQTELRVLDRGPRHLTLELRTGGFLAVPFESGDVRFEIPGFEEPDDPGGAAIPVKRSWVDGIAGRSVEIASVREEDVERIDGLAPAAASVADLVATSAGNVRAVRRRGRGPYRPGARFSAESARVVEVGFQGPAKKALVELAPLRWDAESRQMVLAKRLVVRLSFRGRARDERAGVASRRGGRSQASPVLARIRVTDEGLQRVAFSSLGLRRPLRVSELNLSRLGEAVGVHVEPEGDSFGPGDALYFVSPGASANPYGMSAVYELRVGQESSLPVPVDSPAIEGGLLRFSIGRLSLEENRYYQAGLLEAEDLWFWDYLSAPSRKSYFFTLPRLAAVSLPSRLEVRLSGGSDSGVTGEHQIELRVNGVPVAKESWEGKRPRVVRAELGPGILRAAENEIQISADTGAPYSVVLLDRFRVEYPQTMDAENGLFEGAFLESGVAEVSGFPAGAKVLDVTADSVRWITGFTVSEAGIRFLAEAGHEYLASDPAAVRNPPVEIAGPQKIRIESLQRANYLAIGPRDLLKAATPLLELRRSQGLEARAVAVEDVYAEIGFGEERPEAIRELLRRAYSPSLRYVLLLGDANYDFKDYLGTGRTNQVPPFLVKTSFLWTASDAAYAAVNGDDRLPDVAVGRLPAANVEEARGMVEKILAFERRGRGLEGPGVLVADDPDEAGDFEANAEAIASGPLAGRDIFRIYLRERGAPAAAASIVEAFDEGAGLLSYVGHGGIALWASEGIFDNAGVDSLAPQPAQPLVLTLNCLNGYFHFPYFDSLGEALVKADAKGAIAAVSPSGLSLDGPAHLFHNELVGEIESGRHFRLGDAFAAAQASYAASGAFPELLLIYHLFGDPALSLR